MTIKDLKELIANLPDDGEVFAELKPIEDAVHFDFVMGVYTMGNDLYFYDK